MVLKLWANLPQDYKPQFSLHASSGMLIFVSVSFIQILFEESKK